MASLSSPSPQDILPVGATRAPTARAVSPRARVLSRLVLIALACGLMAGAGGRAAHAGAWTASLAGASQPLLLTVGYGPDNLKDLTDTPPAPRDQQAEAPADPIGPPAPIDNWHAFDLAFQTCLQPLDGPQGAELTLRFGLDAKGRLRGKPIATHSRMTGSREEQRAFVADALANLARCLPLPLTARFGPIVASRPLILRFQGPKPRERGV